MYRQTFVCTGTVPGAGANLISHTLYPTLSENNKLAGFVVRRDAADAISSSITAMSFLDSNVPHSSSTPDNDLVALTSSVTLVASDVTASINTDLDYPRTWANGLQFGGVLNASGAGTYTLHVTVWG